MSDPFSLLFENVSDPFSTLQEAGLAIVAALEEVLRHADQVEAGEAGHEV